MEKEELRQKLLQAREQYIAKNKKRLDTIEPLWLNVQKNLPKLEDIDPYIDFCDTQELRDLWYYGRVMVSSAPLSGEVGRRFHYFIRDKKTDYVLGIVGLASDLTIPIRDKYIGWNNDNKWKGKRINYLMNIQHCIATQPYGEYLTGKLAALSTKSREVQKRFEDNYGHPLAAYTVTSLYGKSSLYNRLEGFIYLGNTKGFSSVLIPLDVKEKMREDFKATKGKHAEIYYNEDGSVKYAYGVVKGYQKLAKYAKVQSVENFRGVYVVPLATNYKEFLRQECDDLTLMYRKPFDVIANEWRTRWFEPRILRLKEGKKDEVN